MPETEMRRNSRSSDFTGGCSAKKQKLNGRRVGGCGSVLADYKQENLQISEDDWLDPFFGHCGETDFGSDVQCPSRDTCANLSVSFSDSGSDWIQGGMLQVEIGDCATEANVSACSVHRLVPQECGPRTQSQCWLQIILFVCGWAFYTLPCFLFINHYCTSENMLVQS